MADRFEIRFGQSDSDSEEAPDQIVVIRKNLSASKKKPPAGIIIDLSSESSSSTFCSCPDLYFIVKPRSVDEDGKCKVAYCQLFLE